MEIDLPTIKYVERIKSSQASCIFRTNWGGKDCIMKVVRDQTCLFNFHYRICHCITAADYHDGKIDRTWFVYYEYVHFHHSPTKYANAQTAKLRTAVSKNHLERPTALAIGYSNRLLTGFRSILGLRF
ncbi:hypothetical protein ANOM_005693 [Aspergillus nomiae NRRL 13137]|uniref:Uncharacterized protein n=1 Tax=Aspergillus nomiae NRRL (strain ATCC 15546 / NRRL 13137 / CBS 260.88 / M93) TaxID=1509407 RepID=A0A0L1J5Z1_ASPN3|nr:uncharacterized protein ANOM_005693 [Aspergillus nomiae NRRL 13137]KNG87085.1 hypothetical protein ANOM_005693 [Aspergillus nomiae NRRL 13137]